MYLVSLKALLALKTAFLTDRLTNFIFTDLLSFFPFGITCVISMSLVSMLHPMWLLMTLTKCFLKSL